MEKRAEKKNAGNHSSIKAVEARDVNCAAKQRMPGNAIRKISQQRDNEGSKGDDAEDVSILSKVAGRDRQKRSHSEAVGYHPRVWTQGIGSKPERDDPASQRQHAD